MKLNLFKIILFLFILVFISCTKTIPNRAIASENIKILVLKDSKTLIVENADEIETPSEKVDVRDKGVIKVTIEDTGKVMLNGIHVNSLPIRVSSENKILYLNNRPFRGKLEVTSGEKGLMVINDIDIEMYLVGLINHEISSKWHIEAVKAQSVIARTYALYQKAKKTGAAYHLEGTVLGQVYSGSITEDESAFEAVRETMGEVLKYNGELALAVYHSNAGGYTEASRNVWARDYPYLQSVESPYDVFVPGFEWSLPVKLNDISAAMNNSGYKVGEIEALLPIEKTPTNRIKKIRIVHKNGKLEIAGEDLRRALGYDKLKSTRFEVKPVLENGIAKSFIFSGKGSGHGVGLSQWGAKGMAENGYTYKEILKHYYKGVEIEKIY